MHATKVYYNGDTPTVCRRWYSSSMSIFATSSFPRQPDLIHVHCAIINYNGQLRIIGSQRIIIVLVWQHLHTPICTCRFCLQCISLLWHDAVARAAKHIFSYTWFTGAATALPEKHTTIQFQYVAITSFHERYTRAAGINNRTVMYALNVCQHSSSYNLVLDQIADCTYNAYSAQLMAKRDSKGKKMPQVICEESQDDLISTSPICDDAISGERGLQLANGITSQEVWVHPSQGWF